MPRITATKSTMDRLAERATIPGLIGPGPGDIEHADGSCTVDVDEATAERLRRINPDLDKALVELLDALDSGQTLARPN